MQYLIRTAVAIALCSAAFVVSVASAANQQEFVQACMDAGDMDRAICECTAKKAKDELSPLAFDFVVAALKKDDASTRKLRGQMKPMELMPAGMFMANGPARCAAEMTQN